jgi:IS5 family transposase
VLPQLLRGNESAVWRDAAYSGQHKLIEQHPLWAQDMTQQRGRAYKYLGQLQRQVNRQRSRTRARVEHLIGIIKRIFGFAKVRYRGLAKNGNRLFVAAALASLFTVRKPLLDALRA